MRLTLDMVERYLDKHVLIFDKDLLKSLFAEADFRGEGSLDVRALKAALSGACCCLYCLVVCRLTLLHTHSDAHLLLSAKSTANTRCVCVKKKLFTILIPCSL